MTKFLALAFNRLQVRSIQQLVKEAERAIKDIKSRLDACLSRYRSFDGIVDVRADSFAMPYLASVWNTFNDFSERLRNQLIKLCGDYL